LKIKPLKNKLLAVLIVLTCMLCGSSWLLSAPCPAQYWQIVNDHASIIAHEDAFVIVISPASDAEISLGCYIKKNLQAFITVPPSWPSDEGVGAEIFGEFLKAKQNILFPNSQSPFFEDTVFLYIDGRKVSIKLANRVASESLWSVNGYPESGSYQFVSTPFLLPGDHTARIVYITPDGKALEYKWHFKIKMW
jgi:hypothetical protein